MLFLANKNGEIKYLGKRPNGGTSQPNDVVLYTKDAPMKDITYDVDVIMPDGTIVPSPKIGIESDMLNFWVPR